MRFLREGLEVSFEARVRDDSSLSRMPKSPKEDGRLRPSSERRARSTQNPNKFKVFSDFSAPLATRENRSRNGLGARGERPALSDPEKPRMAPVISFPGNLF